MRKRQNVRLTRNDLDSSLTPRRGRVSKQRKHHLNDVPHPLDGGNVADDGDGSSCRTAHDGESTLYGSDEEGEESGDLMMERTVNLRGDDGEDGEAVEDILAELRGRGHLDVGGFDPS
jgi:hypothetical protein